jgi:hypothetical protein
MLFSRYKIVFPIQFLNKLLNSLESSDPEFLYPIILYKEWHWIYFILYDRNSPSGAKFRGLKFGQQIICLQYYLGEREESAFGMKKVPIWIE